jgi:hypothetical protein
MPDKFGRIEKMLLQISRDGMNHTRSKLGLAAKLLSERAEKRVAISGSERSCRHPSRRSTRRRSMRSAWVMLWLGARGILA